MPENFYAVHYDWEDGYATQVPVGLWNEHGESYYPPWTAHLKKRGHRARSRPVDRSWAQHLHYLADTTSAYAANWGVVRSKWDLPDTMEAIGRGFLASTSPREPLTFLAPDDRDDDGADDSIAPNVDPALRFVIALSWWIAAEIVRRHPGLLIHEMHPAGGLADVLCVVDPRDGDMLNSTRIMINRAGSIQVHRPAEYGTKILQVTTWDEVLAADNPHEHIKALEVAAELERPNETPASRPVTLAYRLIAALLNSTVNDRQRWDVRNEFHDSSSDDDIELLGHLDHFPSLREHLRSAPTLGLPHEPASHAWIVLRNDKPVAAISTEGRAYFPDRTIELLPAYERVKRSILHLLTETFGDLL
jgi:hypothetical protein